MKLATEMSRKQRMWERIIASPDISGILAIPPEERRRRALEVIERRRNNGIRFVEREATDELEATTL